MKPAQFLLLAFVLGALAKVIHSYRQRRLVPLDFLFWGVVWIGSLLISFYLIFRLYVALARLDQAITALVRAIALEQLPESVDSTSGHGD